MQCTTGTTLTAFPLCWGKDGVKTDATTFAIAEAFAAELRKRVSLPVAGELRGPKAKAQRRKAPGRSPNTPKTAREAENLTVLDADHIRRSRHDADRPKNCRLDWPSITAICRMKREHVLRANAAADERRPLSEFLVRVSYQHDYVVGVVGN
jgi:hypothetical protein